MRGAYRPSRLCESPLGLLHGLSMGLAVDPTYPTITLTLDRGLCLCRRAAADEQLVRDVEGTLEAVAAALSAVQARCQAVGSL